MISENNGMYMPVAPAYGMGGGNGGFGFDGFGGGWGLLILLAVLGWGNGGFGFGGGMNGGMFPWMMAGQMNSNNDVQRGFDQAAIINGITGVNNAVNGVSAAVSNGFAQAEIANNARQMADMQQMFGIQSSLQNCCCQQSANTADLKYTVATEACANRNALAMATRDIIDNDNRNHQATMDKLCQLELDGYKQQLDSANNTISQLRTQLLVAQGNASQNAQTAAIIAINEAQTTMLEQYLAPTPRPAYVVQNPNCCQQNYGCGCAA